MPVIEQGLKFGRFEDRVPYEPFRGIEGLLTMRELEKQCREEKDQNFGENGGSGAGQETEGEFQNLQALLIISGEAPVISSGEFTLNAPQALNIIEA